jgi:hypothetical protein
VFHGSDWRPKVLGGILYLTSVVKQKKTFHAAVPARSMPNALRQHTTHSTQRGQRDREANQPFSFPEVLGIADGVGGWADSGVDPALYSQGCVLLTLLTLLTLQNLLTLLTLRILLIPLAMLSLLTLL